MSPLAPSLRQRDLRLQIGRGICRVVLDRREQEETNMGKMFLVKIEIGVKKLILVAVKL